MNEVEAKSKVKFSGWRIFAGVCVYMLLVMSGAAIYGPLYGMFQEHFNATLVELAFGVSCCQIVGALCGLVAAKVVRTLKPKACMLCGGVMLILYGIVMSSIHSPLGICLGMTIMGFNCGFFIHSCLTDLLMRWFLKKRETVISIALGINMFGVATGQALSSVCVGVLGFTVEQALLWEGISLGVACIIVTLIFVVKNDPADLGQKALGEGEPEYAYMLESADGKEASTAKKDKHLVKEVISNPVFWLLAVATFFAISGIAYACGYLTTYAPTVGIDFNTSAFYMSLMGYISAAVMLVSGKIMGKIGMKMYLLMASIACVITNIGLICLEFSSSAIVLVVISCGYSLGYCITVIHNVIAPALFIKRELATEANTKLIAVMYAGGACLGPVLSAIITNWGFRWFYISCIIINVITLICYCEW